MERRLAAILAADVAGYSRLMGEDEAGTHAALKAHRAELFDPKAAQYNGHIVKLMGDGALMEFPSVVEAVGFAVEVQLAMRQRNAELPEARQILYRIGINIGDIIVEQDDIYGDGVNLAARLEGLAEPGGICVARNVFNQVKAKLDLSFEHLGEKQVKNIAEPVTVYSVVLDDKAERLVTAVQVSVPPRRLPMGRIAAGIALLLGIGGLAWWQPWQARVERDSVESTTEPVWDTPTIVVLPFDNLSGTPDLEYFSDGMTEDIITELSKNPDLKVVSRISSFTYKNKSVPARQVSDELGVRYVLEGSVRKQGDTVRITAQLIDATTDAHVWADRFDEEGTDVFALQDRVTSRIGATLGGHEGTYRKAEYKRVWEMDAARLEEYDYYLRGHSVFFRFTPEDMLKAREIWQEGLRKFPDSGLMRVKIGWSHWHFFFREWSATPEKDLERAYELVQEGLADENLPLVGQWYGHWLNAFVQLFHKRDHERALEEAMITVGIAPNDSETLGYNALVPIYAGNPDLALQWVNRAISREPHVPDWFYLHRGLAYHRKGDCDRALEEFEKVPWPAYEKETASAMCYVERAKLNDARAELAKMQEHYPDFTSGSLRFRLPYKDQKFSERFFEALGEAGLPE